MKIKVCDVCKYFTHNEPSRLPRRVITITGDEFRPKEKELCEDCYEKIWQQ